MKHLKIYEDINEVTDIKKILSHLNKFFSFYGINYSNYFENRTYETEYFISDRRLLFDISVDNILGKHLSIRIENNESFYKYILEYFKTIKGLEIYSEYSNRIKFDIIGNINDIIEQITNDDFDSKYEIYKMTSKFNL